MFGMGFALIVVIEMVRRPAAAGVRHVCPARFVGRESRRLM
ncbi:hypothetical protein FHS43_004298 [Streptosporangium becharense]|uniref:Uncharacterized protein n=1 Tax=Streptosporangium becharense TaxID=1816182 RepID=A0A7W9MEN5_9ACTN|nr:hypothetical protein [Streptosporangium becharense]MBB5818172.1 hypothetical protein [Streptosporangium becharense]